MAEVRTESAFNFEFVGTVVNKATLSFVLKVPRRLLSEVQPLVENLGVNLVKARVVPGTEKGELIPPQLRSLLQPLTTLIVFTLTE